MRRLPIFLSFTILIFLTVILLLSTSQFLGSAYVDALGGTPSTTPIPSLDLPEWITDPSVNIYIAEAYEEEYAEASARFAFINADTDERYVLDYPYIDGVHWYQSPETLYIRIGRNSSSGADNSEGFVEFVDTQTGQLTRYGLRDAARPDRSPESSTNPPENQEARHRVENDNQVYLMTDSGDELLDYPFDSPEYRFADATWHGDFLHVFYWEYAQFFEVIGEDVIYDADGEIVMTFEDASNLKWANDDQPVLLYRLTKDNDTSLCHFDLRTDAPDCDFLDKWRLENNAIIKTYTWFEDNSEFLFFYNIDDSEQGGVCRYDMASQEATCLWEHSLELGPFTGAVREWLDQHTLIFAFSNQLEDIWDSQTIRDRGMCILNLEDNTVHCPTDEQLFPSNTYLRHILVSPSKSYIALAYTGQGNEPYDGICIHIMASAENVCPMSPNDNQRQLIDRLGWSPDERYLVVISTPGGPFSDDKSLATFGFVSLDTFNYQHKGYAFYENFPADLWRPNLDG